MKPNHCKLALIVNYNHYLAPVPSTTYSYWLCYHLPLFLIYKLIRLKCHYGGQQLARKEQKTYQGLESDHTTEYPVRTVLNPLKFVTSS